MRLQFKIISPLGTFLSQISVDPITNEQRKMAEELCKNPDWLEIYELETGDKMFFQKELLSNSIVSLIFHD